MSNRSINSLRLSISALVLSIVAACGGAGGDSGEAKPDDAAIQIISPLVGVWDLPGDWNGGSDEEAYLLIKRPNSQGVSEATIYIPDNAGLTCYNIDIDKGELKKSFNNDDLFLSVPAFNSAIAALNPAGDLEISVYAEGTSSDTAPERVLTANRLGLTENELNLCAP